MSESSLKFFASQIRLACVRRQGFRWSDEAKASALKIYYASPKCYRLLKKVFALPSLATLRRFLQNVPIEPGFNQVILDALKIKVGQMKEHMRICSLVFDEMSIRQFVKLNRSKDHIDGLEDFGNGQRTLRLANHAGVFIMSGITERWKQPIGYCLSAGPVSGKKLKTLVLDCIEKVEETGLRVVVFICDKGTNNRQMLTELNVKPDQPYFITRDGEKVFVLYDPCHLVKNIRNNMKKHCFILNGKNIKWKYLADIFKFDSSRQIRLMPKLTAKHINIPLFKSMSVRLATQVLSRTVAAAMDTLHALGKWDDDPDAHATSKFINDMDSLFDVFNNSIVRKIGPLLRRGITNNSTHFEFLDPGKPNSAQLPSVIGWQLYVTSLKLIMQEL